MALPMVLGSVTLTVTYLLSGADAGLSSLLAAALVPAVVTILIISVFDNLFPPRHDMESDRAEGRNRSESGVPDASTTPAGRRGRRGRRHLGRRARRGRRSRSSPGRRGELVVAQVDASGLPVEATLYSRLVARDFPVGQVRDPSSTTDVTYIDRRGAPATDGDAVLVDIGGGNGQTSVTTRATFDKPLPVALHAEYQQGPKIIAPDDVPDAQGQLRIIYTVTNTTASEQTIRYRDASGRWTVEKQPVSPHS